MDEISFAQLKEALKHTPDNPSLLALVITTHQQRGESDEALSLITQCDELARNNAELGRVVAQVLLKNGRAEDALGFLSDDKPDGLLMKARVLLALERRKEGYQAYLQAIEGNATLEDPELATQLRANVVEFTTQNSNSRLRLISNDDTDRQDLDRVLAPQEESIGFGDIGGLDSVKKAINKKIILPYKKPSLYQRFRKRVGGGILMYGPPGCGKTLLARATAGECHARFFNVSISDVLDMYIGESERKLHALFERARDEAPAVLFFDEVEALGGKRQNSREAGVAKLASQFLSEMDGFSQNNHGVLILAATNVPWAVDSAFRRPGRFDRVIFVPPPDRIARTYILEHLLRQRPSDPDIDIAGLARRTSGFSGADIRELVETAADEAIEASIESGVEQPIGNRHLEQALGEVKPTTLEWLKTARNYARYANDGGQYDDVVEFLKNHAKE